MPRISPDGATIAFSYQGAIWRMPRGGGVMQRLTSGTGFDVEPAWSRDGQRIAFLNGGGFGSGTLAVIDAQTGERLKLRREITAFDKLHFDRESNRLLGLYQPQGEKMRVAWYHLATGELTSAVDAAVWPGQPQGTTGISRYRFALSHDDAWLAVVASADEPGEQGGNRGPQTDLWRVPLAGGKVDKLITWPARIHDVCWRADDQALFIATERGTAHHDLWEVPLANADAGARKLTSGQADESCPSVSDDGRWLLHTDNRLGSTMLVVCDISTGQEQSAGPQKLNFGSPAGWVELNVAEGEPAAATTARVVLRHTDGKYHAPPGALYRLQGSDLHFYLNDRVKFELPPGRYTAFAARGPEHRAARQMFVIRSGETTSLTLQPTRWTDQRSFGWISGESHIHANYGYGHWYNSPATMKLQCAGEDLSVCNFMVANSDGDGVFDREFFLGRPDPLSDKNTILYWNEEFRSTIWGHMTLLDLQRLVVPIYTGFKNTTHPHDVPTNADTADHTHGQGGHVNYTHPASVVQDPYDSAYSAKEMPVDVALGKIDSIDVMGSNHQANIAVWYRLLNCGLRVPASAGTDCFLNRIASRLPGSDRVYVRCPQDFTYGDWITNLRAGRTFVTNGPMLRLKAGAEEPGAVLKLAAPGRVTVAGEAIAQFPLEKLELIANGQVAASFTPSGDDSFRINGQHELSIETSGWIALRARGQRGPTQQAAEAFAHTSPVYVEVAGCPLHSPDDAAYFVKWIERLRTDIRGRNRIPASQQAPVEGQLSQALEFYRKLAAP